MAEEMTQQDLRDFGWEEKSINNGLIADTSFFAYFEYPEVPYDFMRHFKGAYEIVYQPHYRGKQYGCGLCAWRN